MLISHKGEANEANMKQILQGLWWLPISRRKMQLGLVKGEAKKYETGWQRNKNGTALEVRLGGKDSAIVIKTVWGEETSVGFCGRALLRPIPPQDITITGENRKLFWRFHFPNTLY